jgi:ABC-type dipeptide/oligopeptide/nickel transport system ATPase component
VSPPVIEVRDLRTHIVTRWGTIRAVDGVSFSVGEGETLGLVGESGSGKSMTCLSIVRLIPRPAARITGGAVLLDGDDLVPKSESEMQKIRGRKIAMILQDPMSSLNPVFSIGMQVREAVSMYHGLRGSRLTARAAALLGSVRIPSPEARLRAFPFQMSGGMRQRVVGAMAIAAPPRLLIADEPTTSLDLTIQAQYLALLEGSEPAPARHDLHHAQPGHRLQDLRPGGRHVRGTHRRGGPGAAGSSSRPRTPIPRRCWSPSPARGPARPTHRHRGPTSRSRPTPSGCSFAPRCPHVMERCRAEAPPQFTVAPGQASACWLHGPA